MNRRGIDANHDAFIVQCERDATFHRNTGDPRGAALWDTVVDTETRWAARATAWRIHWGDPVADRQWGQA